MEHPAKWAGGVIIADPLKFSEKPFGISVSVKADTIMAGKGKVELDGYREVIIFKNDIPAKRTVCQPQVKPGPDFYPMEAAAPQFPGTLPGTFIGLRFGMGKYFFPVLGDKVVITEVQTNCSIQCISLC